MKQKTKDKIKYWMLFALEMAFFFFLAVIAVILAIQMADFKMNIIYPPMCSCDYPAGTIPQATIIQCTLSCAKMRSDEHSLTIGFLSICLTYLFETIYKMIKRRIQQWQKKKKLQR